MNGYKFYEMAKQAFKSAFLCGERLLSLGKTSDMILYDEEALSREFGDGAPQIIFNMQSERFVLECIEDIHRIQIDETNSVFQVQHVDDVSGEEWTSTLLLTKS